MAPYGEYILARGSTVLTPYFDLPNCLPLFLMVCRRSENSGTGGSQSFHETDAGVQLKPEGGHETTEMSNITSSNI